jgi:hypothetical protein
MCLHKGQNTDHSDRRIKNQKSAHPRNPCSETKPSPSFVDYLKKLTTRTGKNTNKIIKSSCFFPFVWAMIRHSRRWRKFCRYNTHYGIFPSGKVRHFLVE